MRAPHPGTIAAGLLIALFAGAILSLIGISGGVRLGDLASPYLQRILWSSLLQAGLSSILSLSLGAMIALAVIRMRAGTLARLTRALLLTMSVAPTIVVVLGVVAVYGRAGWWASALQMIRVDGWPSIYGLAGILVAHVALNAPYAARVFLHALGQVPGEHHRIAAMCGLSAWDVFRQCDWPVLRREIPGLAALIMLLCFTSFAIVLTLGGGPRYATLEVAIYEALRIEVDFGRAALLSLTQIVIASLFVLAAGRAFSRAQEETSGRAHARADAGSRGRVFLDAASLLLIGAALLPIPLASLAGVASLAALGEADVAQAALTSTGIAVPAALVSLGLATLLAASANRRAKAGGLRDSLLSTLPLMALAVPPFALIAGLYVPLRRFGDNAALAMILVPFVNGVMALPFAYRLIEPAFRLSRARYGLLATHLRLSGFDRLRIVDWPMLKRPMLASLAMALALSLGDFGVAALFGGQDFRTLPLLLNERMGAYRLAEAQAIAVLMLIIAFLLAVATERFADAGDR